MIAAVVLLLAWQATSELKQHVEAGLNAKRAGDLDTAIREFKRVAELAPGLAAAHVNLGAVYYEKKDYAQRDSSACARPWNSIPTCRARTACWVWRCWR